jgi:ADP-ribose pyrophosphatase YjhB (NUDIX family)
MRMEYCASCGQHLGLDAPCRCSACGTEFWANPKPCAGAVVVHDGAVLLVRRTFEPWAGRWDLPGGFCDGAELPVHAAIREVHEETGLEIGGLELLGMWLDRYSDDDPPEVTLNIYYAATATDPTSVRLSAENSEVRWFPADALPAELAFPDHLGDVIAAWRAATRRA